MPMPLRFPSLRRCAALLAALALAALMSGCVDDDDSGGFVDRAYAPLSPQMLALMQAKGTSPQAPVLFRTYKKEAEFEVWKMRNDGRYVLLRTYPMCRWSGQLGPKKRAGDRQVPEGFYAIYPAQMNPRSHYYLSFNVGYPNAYDRAHDYTGDSIMVHGICSSAGCFSMTNPEIAEIYTIAREAFASGQPEIQMQSLPFHMTAENFAKYRLDPNIAFWRELKNGTDNFEVTKQEVAVGVCDLRYVFNAKPADGSSFDPIGPCPLLKRDPMVADEVLAKQERDDARITELVASGLPAVHTVYADGGQNPMFKQMKIEDVSRPDALADGPVDVTIKHRGKVPTPAQLKAARARDLTAAAAAEKKAAALRLARGESEPIDPEPTAATPATAAAVPPPSSNPSPFSSFFANEHPTPQNQPSQGAPVATTPATAPTAAATAPPPPALAAAAPIQRSFLAGIFAKPAAPAQAQRAQTAAQTAPTATASPASAADSGNATAHSQ
jgi:murein L,D-transpeptidase YafK